jgi:hypothetical protein
MKLFQVWIHKDKEYHFKSAVKAFDPNCKIQGYVHDSELFFLETDMELSDIASLTSVVKVEAVTPMGEPSGIVFAMRYKYGKDEEPVDSVNKSYVDAQSFGDITGDPSSDNKVQNRYAEVSHLIGSGKFYRYIKFTDIPNQFR